MKQLVIKILKISLYSILILLGAYIVVYVSVYKHINKYICESYLEGIEGYKVEEIKYEEGDVFSNNMLIVNIVSEDKKYDVTFRYFSLKTILGIKNVYIESINNKSLAARTCVHKDHSMTTDSSFNRVSVLGASRNIDIGKRTIFNDYFNLKDNNIRYILNNIPLIYEAIISTPINLTYHHSQFGDEYYVMQIDISEKFNWDSLFKEKLYYKDDNCNCVLNSL